jgi:subtilisin-like proprotein convertase family protein
MKRNVALALLLTATVALAVLLMPTSLAKKDRSDAAKKALASKKKAPGFPELFKTNAQPQSDPGPISRPAAKFAVSPPLRELAEKAATADYQEPRSIKFRGEEEREINGRNREQIRTINPNVVPDRDGALRESPTAPQVLPTPSLVIDGNSNADNATLFGFRLSPPDTEGDVGPNHYVQVINLTLRIFNKTGTSLLGPVKFSTIFTPLGPPCAAQDDGDPIALYDPMADRWLLSQFCLPNPDPGPYFQEIAISQTGDPTGAYNLYAFDVSTGNQEFNDYPHFGVWPDAYYMSTNQFFQGASFDGGGVFAFNRQKMLLGDPTANFVYFNRNLTSFPEGQAGFLPADMDGVRAPAVGTPCPFAYFVANEFGDPRDGMRIFDFHADFAVPANSTFIERPESAAVPGGGILVLAFDPTSPGFPAFSRDAVPQPAPASPTTARLDAISDRLMHRMQYINFGTYESLVISHTVNVGTDNTLANYRAGVRYYQFRKAPGVNPYAPTEQGTWAGPGGDTTHRWMSSTAMNAHEDLAVGFSASSLTVFPSIRYAARFAADPPGSLAQGEQEIFTGTGVQTDTGSRWGDYSALSLDPSDDCTYWYTQETYTAASQATSGVGWLTKIAKFNPNPACTPFPKGMISGTITDCNTAAALSGVSVKTSDGFFAATNAGGIYTLPKMTPGSYSVTASKPGFTTANAPSVTVTNGNTTTQNFCLTALNIATNGGSSVISGGANNMLDPGEIVTVSLGVTNTGGAGACFTNLVGDVQPTGGVQTHPPTSNYGAFCSGAATVFRNFTFRVDPNLACGSVVTVTLNLQDGATPYGPLTFTFQTGTLNTTNFSYTGQPVAIPDNTPAGVNINIPVSGLVGNTGDVNFKIDGTTCSSAAGSTTVGVDHTWVGDLIFKLTAPNGGPTLSIINRPGGGTFGSSGKNFCQTLLDDEAPGGSLNIQAISSSGAPPAGPPFTGTFFPAVSLSGFDGFNPNGTWVLNVSDVESAFTGNVRAFTLQVSVFQCQTPTATPATISGRITTPDGSPLGGVVMHLSGAASRVTITDSAGNYRFDDLASDNFYTVTPSLANYHFAPASRSFSLVGNITDAAFTANADASPSANAIDTTEYFVRQQYLDFLGREPDQGGLEYWSAQISQCNGDAACISQKRIDVSAAFFASAEFQQTGSYIYGLYAGTLGRTLNYGEFNADRAQVLGGSGLDQAKTAFAKSFVQRPEFTSRYPQDMTREQFVDAVIQTMTQRSGVDQSALRNQLLGDYDAGGRALVVRHASEASSFVAAEYNKAFVLMEYFGYMRREIDQGGYDYWLDVLNHGAAGNYRGMVCAFLTSTEYQLRFSSVITRSNAECGQ